MNILVLNSGSSSLKAKIFSADFKELSNFEIRNLGKKNCYYVFDGVEKNLKIKNFKQGVKLLNELTKNLPIKKIGQRVVHGGEYFSKPTKITSTTKKIIKELKKLAPLHNPVNLECIEAAEKIYKNIPQIAVFDTAFHQSMPEKSFRYPIPKIFYTKEKIRRYGFHGSSHKYVINEASNILNNKNLKIISCHLGNGASITACKSGVSLDTSMGYTPLSGIPMGTRSGDIDPGVILKIAKEKGVTKATEILNYQSGLLGLSGISNHLLEIHQEATKGDKQAALAIEILAYQIAKTIAGYSVTLNGIDAIIFTGGMGENAFYLRTKIIKQLEHLHAVIDPIKNRKHAIAIQSTKSKIKILVIKTNEELQIAKEIS